MSERTEYSACLLYTSVKQVKGGILWGILATWILGIICQLAGIYQVNPEAGAYSLLPDFSNGIAIPSMAPTFLKMDFSRLFSLDFFVVVFAFLFVDLFDTLGTPVSYTHLDHIENIFKYL